MLDPATLYYNQAASSPHIQFVYELSTKRVVFINTAYEHVLHGHQEQVNEELPALLARLHPDDLALWNRYWRLWQAGRLHDEVDVRLVTPNGPDQWLSLLPHWHQDEEGHQWLSGVLRDITAEKRHHENSVKFNGKKNTVLDLLSHELAGAFGVLQQLTEYVRQEVGDVQQSQIPHMLEIMQQTSQKSVALIRNLLNQEFLESAGIPLQRERVDLREKVRECLEPLWQAPNPEDHRLVYECPTKPVYAEVDITKLLQVVTNLVNNAFKFTPSEGRITVRLSSEPGAVRLVVADDGIGIPSHLLPNVFERFTPARRTGLRGEPTTGLGLSLCKMIVELHHGTLTVVSTEGKGAAFTVELPA
ncbi:two-component system, OmpR family, sensor histidine kinase VicK [Hymenobacter mucosus]|uniref:histidine kinase n=1 Tax=Hymenobacter mucosus TaxID=1411120 RepID=A0A239BE37_9BACT|nr:two-component system, OmpR family, sensor histidine kinase VicK [Hymenobacter mucosus]